MRYKYENHPVYAPNSYGGPQADTNRVEPGWETSGAIQRSAYTLHAEDSDFIQPGNFYRHTLSQTDRDHLVATLTAHLGNDVERFIQERAVKLWYQVDSDLGTRVAQGLGLASVLESTAAK
jgi:catalase